MTALAIPIDVDQFTSVLARIESEVVVSPEIGGIRLDDPRFSWLLTHGDYYAEETHRLADYFSHLKRLAPDAEIVSRLQRLAEYIAALQQDSLEGELFGIVAASTNDQNAVGTIVRELQWDGPEEAMPLSDPQYSDATTSAIKEFSLLSVWTPILDIALNIVKHLVPVRADDLGAVLRRAGLIEGNFFSARGLIDAQDIFRRSTNLVLSANGESIIERHPDLEDPSLGSILSLQEKTAIYEVESASVRNAIRNAVEQLHRGTSLVKRSEVIDSLKRSGIAHVTDEQIVSALSRIVDLIELPEGWVGHTGDSMSNPLTARLRKLLSVCISLPIDIARYQLNRENPHYSDIPLSVLAAYVANHPEFEMSNGRMVAVEGRRYLSSETLSRHERLVYNTLAGSRSLKKQDIPSAMVGRYRVPAREVTAVLRTSCVVVPESDEVFSALKPSSLTFGKIRSYNQQFPNRSESDGLVEIDSTSDAPSEIVGRAPNTAVIPEGAAADIGLSDPEDWERDEGPGAFNDSTAIVVDASSGTTSTVLRTIGDLIQDVQEDRLRLPEIQRGYVWKTSQVRDLLDSLYRGYPVGTMLVWKTTERPASRAIQSSLNTYDTVEQEGASSFILDGQQRLTSIMRASVTGHTNIEFNPITESFRVTASRLTTSIRAIPVAEVFRQGPEGVLAARAKDISSEDHAVYLSRLHRVRNIYDRIVPVETLEGYSYEEVTDVFIRVNSRGTRLKVAELAIAEVAYRLPGLVSRELEHYTEQLASRGWELSVQFLLRLIASIATGRVGFKGLGTITDGEFTDAWKRLPPALDAWLSLLTSRLSISTSDVLVGINNHIVPVVWLAHAGDRAHDDRLIEWFVQSSVWSRYSAAAESNLDQDLKDLLTSRRGGPFAVLMERVRQSRPSLRVSLRDIEAAGQKSPLSLLMYLAMVRATKDDLLTGTTSPMLEREAGLRVISRPVFTGKTVRSLHPNISAAQLANMVFVTQSSSTLIKNQDIARFLESIPATRLNAFALPTDPTLWRSASYPSFIKQRSRLLVEAMNEVIKDLAASRESTADAPKTPIATPRPGPRVDITRRSMRNRDSKLSFDKPRLSMFQILEHRILDLDPSITHHDRTTYLGFRLANESQPFVTVARLRKTTLSWVVDCEISDIHDPQKWCRDVSDVGKHGYGNTQFTIEGPHQVSYAMSLISQVYRMKRREGLGAE